MPMTAPPLFDEPPGDVKADESGGAGDEDRLSRHRTSLSTRASGPGFRNPDVCRPRNRPRYGVPAQG